MFFKAVPDPEAMKDWPLHYFEIRDINTREACLKQYLEEHPDSGEDKRRLELLQKRYGKKAVKNRGDLFLRSFMMILIAENNDFHGGNVTAKEKELRRELQELAVLGEKRDDLLREEWKDFSLRYLESCNSHSYRSMLFGTIPLSDETVAFRIAKEIDQVTRIAPAYFHLEEECRELHEIMVAAYIDRVENGREYWEAYLAERQ